MNTFSVLRLELPILIILFQIYVSQTSYKPINRTQREKPRNEIERMKKNIVWAITIMLVYSIHILCQYSGKNKKRNFFCSLSSMILPKQQFFLSFTHRRIQPYSCSMSSSGDMGWVEWKMPWNIASWILKTQAKLFNIFIKTIIY